MKKLLILSVLLLGCVQTEQRSEAFNPSTFVVQLEEKGSGYLLSIELQNKTLFVNDNGAKKTENLSFIEVLELAKFLNEANFLNASYSFEKCADCPEYEIFAKIGAQNKTIKTEKQRLSGPPAQLAQRLKSLVEIRECKTDADCVVDGCSGQVCRAKSKEPVYTTCEFLPEYACFKKEGCACSAEGKCAWNEETLKCIEQTKAPEAELLDKAAETLCVQRCYSEKKTGTDLRLGPCLSDNIAPGWACDVVHEPRQAVDDSLPFACPSPLSGKRYHVVEVDENCKVVRVV